VSTPAAARLSALVLETVNAAQSADREGFESATERLIALDRGGAGRVSAAQAGVLNQLVEQRHPDGLDGEDARAVLEHAARATLPWLPSLDVNILLTVLAGALGVLDPDAEPYPASPLELARHASILIADLLGPSADAQPLVDAAIAEIHRAQTIEMP
jgi:hypothetical protein